jgi:hypothetical protein
MTAERKAVLDERLSRFFANKDGPTETARELSEELAKAWEERDELVAALKDALAFLDRPDITTYEWYKLAPEHVGKFRRAIAKAEVRRNG